MIDVIFAIKFVHEFAAAVALGTWLCLAVFILLAHRSGNTSVVALIFQFAVNVEMAVMAPALLLLPLSGFPLASAIGLTPLNELWIVASLFIFAVIVVCWIATVRTERRIRRLTRDAVLNSVPLGKAYKKLFRLWYMLAGPILIGMIGIYALMIWQPRLD